MAAVKGPTPGKLRSSTGLPGGVPADAYDAQDSGRAVEIAQDVLAFAGARIADERAKAG